MMRRVLYPAREEAGVPWAGFHRLRHTCASILFDRGANVVKVSKWLGHHSPSFTLDTYVHLLDHRIDEPLDLDAELRVGTKVAREPTEIDGNPVDELRAGSGVPTHGMRSRR